MADASTFDSYTLAGLDQAKGLLGKATSPYPSYTPSQAQSPSQMSYYNYTPTAPMNQIQSPDYSVSAGDAEAWKQWSPQSGPNYGSAGTDAQAANYQFQNYGVNAPKYQGLMGGDYEALQAALTSPGAAAAQSAYGQGMTNLQDIMGGKGLYGSSIMQQHQTEGLDKVYQQAMADNAAKAAAQRYGMQQTDLQNASAQDMAGWQARMNESLAGNSAGLDYAKLQTGVNQQNVANQLAQQQQMNALQSGDYQQLQGLMAGQNTAQNAYTQAARAQDIGRENQRNQFGLQRFQLDEGQNKDLFTTRLAAAEDQNTYNANKQTWDYTNAEAQRKWANQQPYEKYLYDQAAGAYQNQNDEALYNRALALGGLGNQSGTAASNYQLAMQQLAAQQQAAQQANQTANTSSWLGAAGLLGGGLLSNSNLTSKIF